MQERLQKILANFGIASRRKAEEIILRGEVTVNGKIANLGDKADIEKDEILVYGKPLKNAEKKVYYLLNKPKGYISSASDERGRKTVTELILTERRIYPVGRLDYNTEGLLILTNDGKLTNLLIHPKFEIEKTYIAKVAGDLTADKLEILRKGVALEDGVTAPSKVNILESGDEFKIEITIHEGRNRQIRRMFAAVGCEVKALKRVKFATLDLKGVARGKFRELTKEEVKTLYDIAENSDNRRGRGGNRSGDNGGEKRRKRDVD